MQKRVGKKESKIKTTSVGTIRIQTNGKIVQKTKTSWKNVKNGKEKFPEAIKVIKLFKGQKNFKALIDQKKKKFLKGQITSDGIIQGARIATLPDGQTLDTAYSLFASNLQIHDENSEDHWDVLFQNKGGTWNYGYTLEKKKKNRDKKYKKLNEFSKSYQKLSKNVTHALKDKQDYISVAMYTLLKTYMRIGNEIYYKASGHKGLTTIKKKDIKIKGNKVTFNYIGKDGVPRLISEKFPLSYTKRLKKKLNSIKRDQFVFTSNKNHRPLKEREFKKGFLKYCGKEFYPHIVRSHYATTEVKSLIKGKKKLTKEEMNQIFLKVAAKLGHKKFVKKENTWKDNYSVTINHYIQPELVEKVKKLVK
jgi:hypothetical protein